MASAGSLFLVTQVLDVSIWAMNFALMFALALGIDYALFIVVPLPRRVLRLQATRSGRGRPRRWTPPARPSSSRGITVLISLSAVMLVPSPAFRSMALGIMLSVVFVLSPRR